MYSLEQHEAYAPFAHINAAWSAYFAGRKGEAARKITEMELSGVQGDVDKGALVAQTLTSVQQLQTLIAAPEPDEGTPLIQLDL